MSPDNISLPTWIPPNGNLQIDDTIIALPLLFAEVDNRIDLTEELNATQ